MSVHERMILILSELPAIGKNQKNTQQGFMFRGHDDILNALNPLLSKHGVIVVPDVLERVTSQRTTAKGGVMYEVNLLVRYRFYSADGDCLQASSWGEGTDTGDKATNKAMTMAFKNVLNQTFAISSAEFKDADSETPEETRGRANNNEPSFVPPAEQPASKGQIQEIAGLIEALDKGYPHPMAGTGVTWTQEVNDWAKEALGKNPPLSQSLTKAEANQLREVLEKWRTEQEHEQAGVPFG